MFELEKSIQVTIMNILFSDNRKEGFCHIKIEPWNIEILDVKFFIKAKKIWIDFPKRVYFLNNENIHSPTIRFNKKAWKIINEQTQKKIKSKILCFDR